MNSIIIIPNTLVREILMSAKKIDFDEVLLYNRIADMYRSRSTESIADMSTALQRQAFQKELDVLNKYNLHKDLQFVVRRNDDKTPITEVVEKYDGKVMTSYIYTSAKTKEIYRNPKQQKKYQKKTRAAYLTANVLKSSLLTTYNVMGHIDCDNCGATLEHSGDRFQCTYCGSTYATEAIRYLLSRFQIVYAAKGLWKVLFFLVPVFGLGFLVHFGVITKEMYMHYNTTVGIILFLLFLGALIYELHKKLKDYIARSKVQSKDPNFSKELLQQRIIDILQLDPQVLQEHGKLNGHVLCRNVQWLLFKKYRRDHENEQIEVLCKVDGLYITGTPERPKLKDVQKKFRFVLSRNVDVITKVHYEPDQYICHNCGSHEMIRSSSEQICSYCGSSHPMDAIDWVLVGIK